MAVRGNIHVVDTKVIEYALFKFLSIFLKAFVSSGPMGHYPLVLYYYERSYASIFRKGGRKEGNWRNKRDENLSSARV